MTKPIYNCTQQELYTICRLGWESCGQHQTVFADFKAKYKTGFIDGRIAEVQAASNLPDFQTRDAASETLRIELSQLAKKCLANWQKLKRYIADAWPPELQKPKTEAAGQNYYAKAGNDDWESCRGLLTSGSQFIAANSSVLQAGDNMPAAFETTFNDNKTDFETKHQAFLDSEETARIETDIKLKVNNDIYTKVIAMFLDGQEIFKDDEAVKRQFIFDQVLSLASGTGTAGFRGTITDTQTDLPLAGVNIGIKGSDKTATTDEDGKFSITQLAADTYNVEASKEGYQANQFKQVVKTGTVSTINIALKPA